jgi:hypothetical protein
LGRLLVSVFIKQLQDKGVDHERTIGLEMPPWVVHRPIVREDT